MAGPQPNPGHPTGIGRLAGAVQLYCRDVQLIVPPGVKDLRAWTRAGAARSDVDRVIAVTAPRKITVKLLEVRR